MGKEKYTINENYDFLNWYNSMVNYGYKGYTTNELQQFVDSISLFYATKEDNVSTKSAINKLPANDYRFFSCYFRKNINYDIKNSADVNVKAPRQDTVEIFDAKSQATLTIYYDESGKFYNIYNNRKFKFLFEKPQKENLFEVYSAFKPFEDRFDIYELDDLMFTHSVDFELRERLAYMINEKLYDEGLYDQADQFRKDASKYFGVKFDRTYHNYVENSKTIMAYKVKCKKLKNNINLYVK